MEPLDRRNRGCLAGLAAWFALVAMAPLVAAWRWWRRRRRGRAVRVAWHPRGGGRLTVLEVSVDAPLDRAGEVRWEVTRAVVEIARRLGRTGEVRHQVVHLPWEEEVRRVPIGPRLQDLGDRFALALAHPPYARRTVLWLALDPEASLHEVVDAGYDPERAGEPEALVQAAPAAWAVAAAGAAVGPSALVRLLLLIPRGQTEAVVALLARLQARLAG